MPINAEQMLAFSIPPLTLRITPRDAMLYALGVGFGFDPTSPNQLPFVYENGIKTVPTFVNQLALAAMACRFSASVYPGETIRTEIWREKDGLRFRSTVPARGVIVLSHGTARVLNA